MYGQAERSATPSSGPKRKNKHPIYRTSHRAASKHTVLSRCVSLHAKARRTHTVEPCRYDVFAPSSGETARWGAKSTPAHTLELSDVYVALLRRVSGCRNAIASASPVRYLPVRLPFRGFRASSVAGPCHVLSPESASSTPASSIRGTVPADARLSTD